MIIRTYEELEFFVRMFRNGNCDLLFIVSNGGLGKSKMIEDIMKEVSHVKINAHISPLGLYILGYHNSDIPIVIDDTDSILDNKDLVALLKQFAETSEVKRVSWISTTKLLGNIPKSYETKSRVLIIANDVGVLSKRIGALLDRGWVIQFEPTTDELLRKIEEIKDNIDNGLSGEEKQKVVDLIKRFALYGKATLRTFVKGMHLYKECNGNNGWEEKLLAEMEINPKLILMDKLLREFNSDKERLVRWVYYGYSRSGYYEWKHMFVQKSSGNPNLRIYA